MPIWSSILAGPVTCKVISVYRYKAVIVVTARKNRLYSPGNKMLVPIDRVWDKYYPRKHGGIVKGKEWLRNF